MPIMVIGDLMVDRYVFGKVDRISPEAPVPVVEVVKEESRPGGAANVALNLHSMGAKPLVFGLTGQDEGGQLLVHMMKQIGMGTEGLVHSPKRRTTTKTRVIGYQQQVLRVDREDRHQMIDEEKKVLWEAIKKTIPTAKGIVLQDYDKGVFDPELIQFIIQEAQHHEVPVCVDPKFRHFTAYRGCDLFKPNLRELSIGLNQPINPQDLMQINKLVQLLRNQMPHKHTLVTLGPHGMLWVDPKGSTEHFPAHKRQIADVSGAGDTVIAVAALGMAAGISLPKSIALANLAGGQVIEQVGVVPVDKEKLQQEGN